MVALLSTIAGSAFLIAPTAFHRIRFRDRDKEALLRISNVFAIGGLVFLAIAMTASSSSSPTSSSRARSPPS